MTSKKSRPGYIEKFLKRADKAIDNAVEEGIKRADEIVADAVEFGKIASKEAQKKSIELKKILTKPKREEVHVHSIKLYYEAILMVSGIYIANFFRKAIHPIKVDFNCKRRIFHASIYRSWNI